MRLSGKLRGYAQRYDRPKSFLAEEHSCRSLRIDPKIAFGSVEPVLMPLPQRISARNIEILAHIQRVRSDRRGCVHLLFRVEQQLERFRQQRRYDQAGRMKFHGHDAYIVLLAFHHRIDIGRLPGENRKLQLRIRTQKLLIDRRHQRIVQRIHADNADARAVVLLHSNDLTVQIHPLLRQWDKLLAAGSQLYRALTFVAHDQLNTDLLFQLADPFADARLRDIQGFRRL